MRFSLSNLMIMKMSLRSTVEAFFAILESTLRSAFLLI